MRTAISKDFVHFLRFTKTLKKGEFEHLVDYLSDNSIDHICECVYNVINTDLKINPRKLRKLKSHVKKNMSAKRLKIISNKKAPLLKRRKAIKQEGRGLPFLLASVIPFLANLFMPK